MTNSPISIPKTVVIQGCDMVRNLPKQFDISEFNVFYAALTFNLSPHSMFSKTFTMKKNNQKKLFHWWMMMLAMQASQ